MLFVAVFGLIAYSHFQYLADKRDARMEDMERVSQTVSASFDGLTHDLESFSLSTAITLGDANLQINEEVSDQARQSVNAYLGHLFESHGLLRAIFVTDTSGRVVFDNDGTSYGLDLSDRPYIQALQAGESLYWSDGFAGSATGRTVITHSRAIVNPEGETSGYFVLALFAESLAARLPAGIANVGHVVVVDNAGSIVLRVPDDNPDLLAGTVVANWDGFLGAHGGESIQVRDEHLPIAPGDRYGALTTMENLGWVVGYTLPASEVEGSTTGLFLRDMALLGAIILAAFVAMWLFANQTVRPLTRLTEIAGAMSNAESMSQPVRVDSGNAEVSLLAETMEHMRASIAEREDKLKAQANVIEAIENFGQSLASELDIDRAIQSITESAVELVGAGAAQIVLLLEDDDSPQPIAVAGPQPSLALEDNDLLVAQVLSNQTVEVGDRESGRNSEISPRARSLLGVPLHTPTGEVSGALLMLHAESGAFTDYHRRLAEGLARWACIVLENATLYAQSQDLIGKLEKSNEAKNEFLGIVSHELRTPITTIYGGTLLLRLRRESLPEQAFNDMIVSISEEAERLHHLVQDLLMIARTELVTEPRPIRLADVLQTTITDFSSTHKRAVEVSLDPELPPALGDSTYVRQVITNLISNADKYTPLDQPIKIDITHEEHEIVVRVKDKGDGVAGEDLPQIFDSFYRSKEAVERASGSGLGLTVCKRLIETLGGRIWAENRPEGGLEVGFTLKAVEAPEPAAVTNGESARVRTPQPAEAAPGSNGATTGET